jgi:sterol 24-C-methyltransferase
VAVQLLTPADPIGRCLLFLKQLNGHERRLTCSANVEHGIDEYNALHQKEGVEQRNAKYQQLVNAYYDLATVFYEWGWGASFHFASRYSFETFAESIRRHEYHLASKLQVYSCRGDAQILDVGCGIGGPMRNIARFTSCHVTGLTLNPYQVDRGNELCQADATVSSRCRSVQGDFMNMPFGDQQFDAAYAIEATCHAPNRVQAYSEIYRVLKPGCVFACYEWCMTDKYIPGNELHERIKKQIEEGDGLPDVVHTSVCLNAMKEAGFEILESRDMQEEEEIASNVVLPWMLPLMPSWNIFTQRFQFTWLGFRLTNFCIVLLEKMKLAPKGTIKTQRMLQEGAFGLAAGGSLKIFTPMYLMVGRVPMNKQQQQQQQEHQQRMNGQQ